MTSSISGQAEILQILLTTLTESLHALTQAQVCCYNISYSDYQALRSIQHQNPMPLSLLPQALGLSPSGVTRLVDRLEAKGYAQRSVLPSDARALQVELTAAGAALLENLEGQVKNFVQELLAKLTEPMRVVLITALQNLDQALEQVIYEQRK